MSKLGIALQAFAIASISGGYVPPSYYRKQTTYDRDVSLSVTNPKVAQSVSTFVQGGAGNACAGVNQTITSTGTTLVTMTCTGTVNMSSWGPGNVAGTGGGQFAQSSLSVTNGQVWVAFVASAPASGAAGHPSFWCPQAQANCTTAGIDPVSIGNCSTPSGLSTTNFVCAASGNGGTNVANSVGTTKFHGGSTASAAGGGAAGPDGNGNNNVGTTGGSGDAGLGGAGGTGAGNGVSNALGGGGGGASGLGGAPGGGSGAYSASGSRGQDVVHGELCLPPSEEGQIKVAGSGYSGGTISAA